MIRDGESKKKNVRNSTTIGSKRSATVIGHNSGEYDDVPYSGFLHTQDEAKDIVRYAQERHITVIPEIDLPGHMQAALAAYPELGCTGGPYEVWKMGSIGGTCYVREMTRLCYL